MYVIINEYMINIKEVCCFKYDVKDKELTIGFINTKITKINNVDNDVYERLTKYINLNRGD